MQSRYAACFSFKKTFKMELFISEQLSYIYKHQEWTFNLNFSSNMDTKSLKRTYKLNVNILNIHKRSHDMITEQLINECFVK